MVTKIETLPNTFRQVNYVMLCDANIILFEGGVLYCHISLHRPLHLPDPRAHPAWICQRYQIHVHAKGMFAIPGTAVVQV